MFITIQAGEILVFVNEIITYYVFANVDFDEYSFYVPCTHNLHRFPVISRSFCHIS